MAPTFAQPRRAAVVVNPTKVDVTAGGRQDRFAVMAGVGFDAQVMRDAPKELKSTVGWPVYLVSAAENLRGSSIPLQVRIDDGQPIHASARTVVMANVAALPGGVALLPEARPDDGTLDVAIVESHSLVDWARVAGRVLTRRAHVDDRYSTHQGTYIQTRMRAWTPRQADGDLIGDSDRLDVQVEPGALLLLVPADSEPSQAGHIPTELASAGRPPERQSK